MKTLKLPRLLSDHMVLQQEKKIRIWGEDEPGRKVTVSLLGKEYGATADKDGYWEVFLEKMGIGGAHKMVIRDDAGEERTIEDILIGDVWMCSGQSNMELPMRRVIDHYPYEMEHCRNDCIRTFKIMEHSDFHGPLKDHLTGEWKFAAEDTLLDFSATAYFFAKHMYQLTGVPIGLINASLGGSRIESWMSRDMLEGYDDILALADKYADDGFVKERIANNERQTFAWHSRLDAADTGLKEDWTRQDLDVSDWKEAEIPFFFKDTELAGFIGSVWFRREFTAAKEYAAREAKLWLGTIVDSDTVYINGTQVGHTDYQYPPRKYTVPAGILREGRNQITIHVKSEIGQGRFTDGKPYKLFWDGEEQSEDGAGTIELAGVWKYKVGASCGMPEETDFVNWKPTGLYHGMIAPCHKFQIAGFLWYQGESAARAPENYADLMKRLIKGYREKWGGEELPFYYVQLPNFSTERYDSDRDESFSDWPAIREAQRKALELNNTGMAVTIDVGEDNDLHPLEKDVIGYRLAMQAATKLYNYQEECDGPQIKKVDIAQTPSEKNPGKTVWKVTIKFRYAAGMMSRDKKKGRQIRDFEFVDKDGVIHTPKAEIAGDCVILTAKRELEALQEIRYCYHNTYRGALIYNGGGYPMSPFRIKVRKRKAM